MTAEVVLMNKQAVAMAADSAGTIGAKIFNSNNKLFMLSKRHPVGVMIYDSAEIMGYPWESIIKTYRKDLRKEGYPTLLEYVEDFKKYLKEMNIFDEKLEESYVKTALNMVVENILGYMARNKEEALEQALSKIKQMLNKEQIKCILDEPTRKGILSKYKSIADNLISENFKEFKIDKNIRSDIFSIMEYAIFDNAKRHLGCSGLVFAGFGEKEIFPTTTSFIISSVISKKLIMSEQETLSINIYDSAKICPFAQKDMVDSFTSGIDSNLKEKIEGQMNDVFYKIPENIVNALHISQEQKALMIKSLGTAFDIMATNFFGDLNNYVTNNYELPISQGVASLPPDELASMAETLVNLTSFKRRIFANQRETVGGPIDVAVITKGDGFIWIKRKHYFDKDKNHHFFSNYYKEERADAS